MTTLKMIFRWKVVIKKSFKIWVSRADTSVNHYNWIFTIEFSGFNFKKELGIDCCCKYIVFWYNVIFLYLNDKRTALGLMSSQISWICPLFILYSKIILDYIYTYMPHHVILIDSKPISKESPYWITYLSHF